MEEYPNMELDVWGHTDIKGSDSYNKTLSMNRAKVVYNWLINQGISKNRLSYDGFGYHKPIATNDTDEGRQLNRRTELHIKKVK
jgi:OOP family OmpA-OmpF porin